MKGLASTGLILLQLHCLASEDERAAAAFEPPSKNGLWRVAEPSQAPTPFTSLVLSGCEFQGTTIGRSPLWGTYVFDGTWQKGTVTFSVLGDGEGRRQVPEDRRWRFEARCYAEPHGCYDLLLVPHETNVVERALYPTGVHLTRVNRWSTYLASFQDSKPSYVPDRPMTCAMGREAVTLEERAADCNGDTVAETNLLDDPDNCGACGYACPDEDTPFTPVKASSCVNGLCEVAECLPGSSYTPRQRPADCNGRGSDFCEVVDWEDGCPSTPDATVHGDVGASDEDLQGWGEAWLRVRITEEQWDRSTSTAVGVKIRMTQRGEAGAYAVDVHENGSCSSAGAPALVGPEGRSFSWPDTWSPSDGRDILLHVRDTGGGVACIPWTIYLTKPD